MRAPRTAVNVGADLVESDTANLPFRRRYEIFLTFCFLWTQRMAAPRQETRAITEKSAAMLSRKAVVASIQRNAPSQYKVFFPVSNLKVGRAASSVNRSVPRLKVRCQQGVGLRLNSGREWTMIREKERTAYGSKSRVKTSSRLRFHPLEPPTSRSGKTKRMDCGISGQRARGKQ